MSKMYCMHKAHIITLVVSSKLFFKKYLVLRNTSIFCYRYFHLFQKSNAILPWVSSICVSRCLNAVMSYSVICIYIFRCGRRRVILRKGHIGYNLYFIYTGAVSVVLDKDDGQAFIQSDVVTLKKGACFGVIRQHNII